MGTTNPSTYSNDPANVPLDLVRFLIGDTVCAQAFLSDAEIEALIALEGGAGYAAVRAAESIAGQLARKIDIRTGAVAKSLSQQFDHYMTLAKKLQAQADAGGLGTGGAGAPIFTALTKDDKLQDREDEGLVQPNFRIGQDDNPRQVLRRDQDPKLNIP